MWSFHLIQLWTAFLQFRMENWDFTQGEPNVGSLFIAATSMHLYMFLLFQERLKFKEEKHVSFFGLENLTKVLFGWLGSSWWIEATLTECDKDYAKRSHKLCLVEALTFKAYLCFERVGPRAELRQRTTRYLWYRKAIVGSTERETMDWWGIQSFWSWLHLENRVLPGRGQAG